ncbi:hypothetical protein ABZV00_26350, partial [Micromonospora sp. NPDC005173]
MGGERERRIRVSGGRVAGLRRWTLTILMAACGVLVAVAQLAAGLPAVGGAELLVFLALALLLSPWAFPRSVDAAEAQ